MKSGSIIFKRDLAAGGVGETIVPSGSPGAGEFTFARKFCRAFGCPARDMERRVLWRCLYHATTVPLAWLVMRFNPDFFRSDLEMISEIKAATTHAQVREILADHHTEFLKKSFLRQRLKLRVSRTKLISLARAVLRSEF